MKTNIRKKLFLAVMGLIFGLILAEAGVRVLMARSARRVPEKRYVDAPAEPGTIRMALLGGSTSFGSPYSDVMDAPPGRRFNLLSVTRFLLEQRYGCPAVEIDNYAGPNWSAETTTDHYFERPGPRPDVLVLYSGQNETTRYYTPNMTAPPAILSPLNHLASGNLLLRRLFTRQVAPEDQRYTGKFFSDNVIPSYERAYNLTRYRQHVEGLIRHAAAEGIFLVIVIPQSNYLFPPTRSVYRGPAGRKAEALRLFKQAWRARNEAGDPERARELLEQLDAFCSFADLSFELGELHYSRGDVDAALPYLRRARESDGFPVCITPAYRRVLRELVEMHDVPYIDLDEVLREKLGRPLPDYHSFLDDCHLYLDVYLELSREIIRVMHEEAVDNLALPPRELEVTPDEWAEKLGITPTVQLDALSWEANYHVSQADYTFLKLTSLKRAENYFKKLKDAGLSGVLPDLAGKLAYLDREVRSEIQRIRTWVRCAGEMPVGEASIKGPPRASFGGGVSIELSQGDALLANGEVKRSIDHYHAALVIDPSHVTARCNLGVALVRLGQLDEAVGQFERVVALDPQHLQTRRNLGKTLLELKRFEEAVVHHRAAARMAPGNDAALREYCVAVNALAWRLATDQNPACRDGNRAIQLAEEACNTTGYKSFETLGTLAAAYAEAGRFEEAVTTATRAVAIARQHGNPAAEGIARCLATYRERRPWREDRE